MRPYVPSGHAARQLPAALAPPTPLSAWKAGEVPLSSHAVQSVDVAPEHARHDASHGVQPMASLPLTVAS